MRLEDVKIGMPVRYSGLYKYDGLTKDKVYAVEKVAGIWVQMIRDGGAVGGYNPSAFEPAYTLEVGCKVKSILKDDKDNHRIGIVVKAFSDVVIVNYGDKHGDSCYTCSNLIVIEPAPQKTDFQTYAKQMADVGAMFSYEDIEKARDSIDWEAYSGGSIHSTKSLGTPIIGFDPALSPLRCRCAILSHDEFKRIYTEENKMPEEDRQIVSKLAEKMKDELVGFDTHSNTVFLKKAGEVMVLKRDITIELTDADIEKLLKSKGLDATLGEYEIERFSGANTVRIVKFKPVDYKLA